MHASKRPTFCLSGEWTFQLDPGDVGLGERWYADKTPFGAPITVPGSWQAQGHGDHKHLSLQCQGWGMPAQERELCSYRGTGWYRRAFKVPSDWDGQRVWLVVGGTHPLAEFWIDDISVGRHGRSFFEYRLDLTDHVKPGSDHVLTVRISEYPGTEQGRNWLNHVQGGILNCLTTWSGIYRDVYLQATNNVWIESVSVVPCLKEESATLLIRLGGDTIDEVPTPRLSASVLKLDGTEVGAAEYEISGLPFEDVVCVEVPVPDPTLWSPDDPNLYRVEITLTSDGQQLDTYSDRFGMRTFTVDGNRILLNGTPVWLRGFGDDSCYPLSLCPSVERKVLEKELRQAKDYGFNYVDHLVGFPHKEYLDLADELGLLMQMYPTYVTSGSLGEGVDQEYRSRAYLERGLCQVFNHPSVMIYSVIAESYNYRPELIETLAELTAMIRALDPSRLLATTGGYDRASAGRDDTDLFEMAGQYTVNPADLDGMAKPVIIHEYHWWSSYPDPSLKVKYKHSAIRPFFIEHAEKVAGEKGFTEQLPVFVENSQRLQTLERKIGIEKARRTCGVNGYAIWLGKDFSEAVEGVWDDFCDPKNVSAEEFMRSNGETVLLIDKDYYYRCFFSDDRIAVNVWLSHYGRRPLSEGILEWRLVTGDGETLASDSRSGLQPPVFATERLLYVNMLPKPVTRAVKATLQTVFKSAGAEVRNSWDFWIFPKRFMVAPGARIGSCGGRPSPNPYHFISSCDPDAYPDDFDAIITDKLTPRLIDFLENGGRILVNGQGVFPELPCEFKSISWNKTDSGNSGTVVRDHPALGDFPHDGWCDLQFFGLFDDCTVVDLDAWPVRIEPIIRSIDSYKSGRTRALLFEVRVGRGKLLVNSLNLRQWRGEGHYYCEVEALYLFDQLLRYLVSDAFEPEVQVSADLIRNMASS